jgi:hypothetical protein
MMHRICSLQSPLGEMAFCEAGPIHFLGSTFYSTQSPPARNLNFPLILGLNLGCPINQVSEFSRFAFGPALAENLCEIG